MQHPDEGTIHSWLDGALTPEETSAIEGHVASCAECAAVVAEARGIRAAATRILSALDDVPAGVVPTPDYFADVRAAEAASVAHRSARRPLWARPGVRAAAALIAVGGLSWAVLRSSGRVSDAGNTPMAADSMSVGSTALSALPVPDTPEVERVDQRDLAERSATARTTSTRARTNGPAPAMKRAQDAQSATIPERDLRQAAEMEDRRRADSALRLESIVATAAPEANKSAVAGAGVGAAATAPTQQPMAAPAAPAEPPVPRIVIDRGYVDSVLAADSLETADTYLAGGRAPAAARVAAPQSDRAARSETRSETRSEARPSGSPTMMRAQGCWLLETSPWSPRYRATDTLRLLPRRIELMLDRGIADEAGERLVRPAPGEPALPIGATGIWRVIATNQVRLTIATHDRWTTVTLTVGDDSLSGTARAYSNVDRLLRRATVSARRVVCRTEP